MKKILKKITLITMLFSIICASFGFSFNQVMAQNEVVQLYNKTTCEPTIVYKGVGRYAIYVEYEKDGKVYPAYCLDSKLPGIGDIEDYSVTVTGKINDVKLWRIIVNGYPYKTLSELGVANEKEAYLATKQAVYTYLNSRNLSDYASDGTDAGNRTYNAFRKILDNADKMTENPTSPSIKIIETNDKWEQDNINKEYLSKIYKVNASGPIEEYKIKINNEEMVVSDINNNKKDTFKDGEQFKILVPLKSLTQDETIIISAEAEMHTKPVVYGAASADKQSYALTGYEYEKVQNKLTDKVFKNTTQIKILKVDNETKNPIKNTKFEILSTDGQIIYNNLISDDYGEINIEQLIPGKYILKEVEAADGYIEYNDDIEFELDLNESITITVNNTKKPEKHTSSKKSELEVTKEVQIVDTPDIITNKKEKIEVNQVIMKGEVKVNSSDKVSVTQIVKEAPIEINQEQETNVTQIVEEAPIEINQDQKTNTTQIVEEAPININQKQINNNNQKVKRLPVTGM